MKKNRFPDKDKIKIQFSHVAYRMAERFSMRDTGIYHYQTWTEKETLLKISQCDVLVISGFWNNALLEDAKNLKYVQSIGAGYDGDKFDVDSGGVVTFLRAPDYESPGDTNADNIYDVAIVVTNGKTSTTLYLNVDVSNVEEVGGIELPSKVSAVDTVEE